jgi:branched-chain amino acid transport system ATP-binding protein
MSLLKVQNVSRHFGSLVAVNGVSLTVEPGELVAVIGPNGAGKTTFFNLISGFFPPTSGSILFDERDITALPPHKRVAMGMARTFQITQIFPELSVRENLRIPVELAAGMRLQPWLSRDADGELRARVVDLMEMGGLTDKADRLVGELPHGDQRATEIMMSLALKPRLLLLDEPTAGMNPVEVQSVAELIRQVAAEGHSVLLVEHNVRLVMGVCDRITVLDFGKVIAEGRPAEVAADPAVIAAYLGSGP